MGILIHRRSLFLWVVFNLCTQTAAFVPRAALGATCCPRLVPSCRSHPLPRRSARRWERPLLLFASSSPQHETVTQRLDLSGTFERWRFLQTLLDAETPAEDVNELLYRVLYAFLHYPRPPSQQRQDENASPTLNSVSRAAIEHILSQDEQGRGVVWALRDPECSPGSDQVLEQLEKLLPDPEENEDAFKGAWDTVLELHGRESVKVREAEQSPSWNVRCKVARILIYYDFLANGVVEEPFS